MVQFLKAVMCGTYITAQTRGIDPGHLQMTSECYVRRSYQLFTPVPQIPGQRG